MSATNTMRAAVYHGINDLRIESLPIPKVGARDVLIRCRAAAICGTDQRIYRHGHSKIPAGHTVVLGHELAGDVVETGREVVGVRPGLRVAIAPNIGCGQCALCLKGLYNLCQAYEAIGLTLNGGFAEYVLIPECAVRQGAILSLPDSVTYEEAALNEPLACVYNGFQRCPVAVGDSVLIVGAGPIGLMQVIMAKLAGASPIMVSEPNERRLNVAKALGADILINPKKDNLEEVVRRVTGAGVNVIVTACPAPEVQKQTLNLAALRGKINFFGGLPKGHELVEMDTNLIHYNELLVTGSHGSSTWDCLQALHLQTSGKISLKVLVTARYPLTETLQALATAAEGGGLKTVIMPGT